MRKVINMIFILIISLLIVACGKTTADELYLEAEYLYSAINENWQTKNYLNNTDQEYANDFIEKYVKNYKDYSEEEQEVIKDMDKLINSHKLYFVSMRTQGEANDYEQTIDNTLDTLSEKFNK